MHRQAGQNAAAVNDSALRGQGHPHSRRQNPSGVGKWGEASTEQTRGGTPVQGQGAACAE